MFYELDHKHQNAKCLNCLPVWSWIPDYCIIPKLSTYSVAICDFIFLKRSLVKTEQKLNQEAHKLGSEIVHRQDSSPTRILETVH